MAPCEEVRRAAEGDVRGDGKSVGQPAQGVGRLPEQHATETLTRTIEGVRAEGTRTSDDDSGGCDRERPADVITSEVDVAGVAGARAHPSQRSAQRRVHLSPGEHRPRRARRVAVPGAVRLPSKRRGSARSGASGSRRAILAEDRGERLVQARVTKREAGALGLAGTAFWPESSSASAIAQDEAGAKPGAGMNAGRCSARPRARANSQLVTGWGR